MKMANINGKAHLVTASGGVDVAEASQGRFSGNVEELLTSFDRLEAWLRTTDVKMDSELSTARLSENLALLEAPISHPSQIFAIGLNYLAHGHETGMNLPSEPMVFPKFASSLTGPGADIALPSDMVDWEVELVAVVGKPGRNIPICDAMSHIAAYCVGQDLSDRKLQFVSEPAQFGLAKSYESFAPIGPWLTTADEVDSANLQLVCRTDKLVLQDSNTSNMIFDVATLVTYLSGVCELRTGDLIFTGTPDGVGLGRTPQRYIEDGWTIETSIQGLGSLRNTFVAGT